MEAEAPPDVSTELHTLERETKEEVETPTDFYTKLHPGEEKNKEAKTIVDTTQPLSKEQNEAPADASEPHSVELEGKSKAAESSNELQAPKRKTRKVLKPRSKIAKESPASNSLNKKRAKVTVAELEGEEEIKKKGVLLINNGNNCKEEDTTEALCMEQENKEETKSAAYVSTEPHSMELENKDKVAESSNELPAQQKNAEEFQAAPDVSAEPHSVELKNKSESAPTSEKLQAPKKRTVKVWKTRSKIGKKSPANASSMKKKVEATVPKVELEKATKTSNGLPAQQKNEEEFQAAPDVSTEPHSVELKNESESAPTSEKLQAPKKRTVKVLKARSKIAKKSPASASSMQKKVEATVPKVELENAMKTSNELPAQQKNEKEFQAAPDVSIEPHFVEQKNKGESAPISEKLQAPNKRTVKVLKARSKIAKKSPASASSMKKKVEATIPKVELEKAMKEKHVLSVKNGNSSKEDSLKKSLSGDKMQWNADDFRSEGKDNCNLKGKNSCIHVEKNAKEPAADHSEERRARALGKSKRKWKETVKQKSNKSFNNLKDNEKPDHLERKPRKEKQEKLGGLIFMCNSKTKPDCLRYGVMGVSLNKKDLVLGVRPGLKLFLYDYDLKLMHGIYKATSPGGMRLEPRAFDGAFPVQVRFEVHLDCYPLPESILKNGMKENFTTKHKFKTELSLTQVSRLAALFQPIELHPKELPARSPRLTKSRTGDSHVRARESRHLSRRETSARDPYADRQSRRLPVLAHERDRPVVDRELAPRPRAESREMYPTEQEYRAFGLRGERRNSDFPRHISLTLRPYREDHERERLRRLPEEIHKEAAPAPREYAVGRSYTSDREYGTYSRHRRQELHNQVPPRASTSAAATFNSYREDPCDAYRHGAASVDPYAHRSRREDIPLGSFHVGSRRESYLSEKDRLRRREVDRDESHPRYIDNLMGPDRARHYRINENNAASLPVSSRYSFAGPRI